MPPSNAIIILSSDDDEDVNVKAEPSTARLATEVAIQRRRVTEAEDTLQGRRDDVQLLKDKLQADQQRQELVGQELEIRRLSQSDDAAISQVERELDVRRAELEETGRKVQAGESLARLAQQQLVLERGILERLRSKVSSQRRHVHLKRESTAGPSTVKRENNVAAGSPSPAIAVKAETGSSETLSPAARSSAVKRGNGIAAESRSPAIAAKVETGSSETLPPVARLSAVKRENTVAAGSPSPVIAARAETGSSKTPRPQSRHMGPFTDTNDESDQATTFDLDPDAVPERCCTPASTIRRGSGRVETPSETPGTPSSSTDDSDDSVDEVPSNARPAAKGRRRKVSPPPAAIEGRVLSRRERQALKQGRRGRRVLRGRNAAREPSHADSESEDEVIRVRGPRSRSHQEIASDESPRPVRQLRRAVHNPALPTPPKESSNTQRSSFVKHESGQSDDSDSDDDLYAVPAHVPALQRSRPRSHSSVPGENHDSGEDIEMRYPGPKPFAVPTEFNEAIMDSEEWERKPYAHELVSTWKPFHIEEPVIAPIMFSRQDYLSPVLGGSCQRVEGLPSKSKLQLQREIFGKVLCKRYHCEMANWNPYMPARAGHHGLVYFIQPAPFEYGEKPYPVFCRRESNQWEYCGEYIMTVRPLLPGEHRTLAESTKRLYAKLYADPKKSGPEYFEDLGLVARDEAGQLHFTEEEVMNWLGNGLIPMDAVTYECVGYNREFYDALVRELPNHPPSKRRRRVKREHSSEEDREEEVAPRPRRGRKKRRRRTVKRESDSE